MGVIDRDDVAAAPDVHSPAAPSFVRARSRVAAANFRPTPIIHPARYAMPAISFVFSTIYCRFVFVLFTIFSIDVRRKCGLMKKKNQKKKTEKKETEKCAL